MSTLGLEIKPAVPPMLPMLVMGGDEPPELVGDFMGNDPDGC